jgi:hypothetical protein
MGQEYPKYNGDNSDTNATPRAGLVVKTWNGSFSSTGRYVVIIQVVLVDATASLVE